MIKKSKKSKPIRKRKKTVRKTRPGSSRKSSPNPSQPSLQESKLIILAGESRTLLEPTKNRSDFDLNPSDIDGDTTIGDLIVAFPRTRQVLVKHGISFDVEEAGYVYMTLSVFSALHGLKTNSLIDELVILSKEVPSPETQQTTRPITSPPAI